RRDDPLPAGPDSRPGGLRRLLHELGARRNALRGASREPPRGPSAVGHRRYQRGETFGGGPSEALATSSVGSFSETCPFSAIAKCSPSPSTLSARMPNEVASATKSGFVRSTPSRGSPCRSWS